MQKMNLSMTAPKPFWIRSLNHADEKMKEVSFIIFTVWIFIRYQRKNRTFIWMDCAKHAVKYVNLDHVNRRNIY